MAMEAPVLRTFLTSIYEREPIIASFAGQTPILLLQESFIIFSLARHASVVCLRRA